ncbi:hypothetical protein BU17DRAFT_75976 [Hysterangium stoloniferum]|nr:hypothetical protein BU17DRAFT_75976 [Hysterangium stoloniferum]
MSLVKIPLLALAAIAAHVAVNPPNPPLIHQTAKGTLFDQKVVVISYMATEATLILFARFNVLQSLPRQAFGFFTLLYNIPTRLCPDASPLIHLATVTPTFLFAMILIYVGAGIRFWCYQTLGKLFTYEIAIQPNHKLITSGPYSIVRHPSYTSGITYMMGCIMVYLGPKSCFDVCGITTTYPIARSIIIAWFLLAAYVSRSMMQRIDVEDRGLKAAFGKEWEHYRQKVPYILIPGII